MRRIDLNELPGWSPWPARFLGSTPVKVRRRDYAQVQAEYDGVKYAESLRAYRESGESLSPQALRLSELRRDPEQDVCVSFSHDLFVCSWREIQTRYYEVFLETVAPAVRDVQVVVELGCGYGYNLWFLRQHFPEKRYLGGDLSSTALELANELYAGDDRLRVRKFDFYDDHYALLDEVQTPAVLFTCHAVEQLPSTKPMLDALSRNRSKISRVFHFEPCYELHGNTLLGLLRRRYAEVVDYNRDLYSELERRDDIAILDAKADVIGLNPLNPSSVIEWRFREA